MTLAGSVHRSDLERHELLGLFAQAPGWLCFLRGPDHVFELANDAYYQLVGHRDILGRSVRDALPEVEGQGYCELLDRVFRTGEAFLGRGLKVQLQREPGGALSDAYVDFIYQPIREPDGRVIGVMAQGQDVTDLKREEAQRTAAEEALRLHEARYRALFEAIDRGFCIIEMVWSAGRAVDYRFLETNAAFEANTGLRNATGKTIRELVPNIDELWFERYGEVARTGRSAQFEHFDPALDRSYEAFATRVGNPELGQVAILFKDISEEKRLAAERQRLLELESIARQRAEESSRLKDDFLAAVSHELRTPLNAIVGWAHMLRTGELSPERVQRAVEVIERNARVQTQLVEDLLDLSRIVADKIQLASELLLARSFVEAAIETVRPSADSKRIVIETALRGDCYVRGDGPRLQQVVWNLLLNAVKFTPPEGRVQVRMECHGVWVQLTVSDTGEGIAPEHQQHIFEPFRQAAGGTSRRHGGLGLGLAIVRQLVAMHGGTVAVASEGKGRGAVFTVELPMASVQAGPQRSSPDLVRLECPAELAGILILVVDDEADTREMLRILLESAGFQVMTASSAVEARQVFASRIPDVLLSDVSMPEEDGYALIRSIRARGRTAGGNVAAIALTANALSEDRGQALHAGFDAHLAKPVTPGDLLAVVGAVLRQVPARSA